MSDNICPHCGIYNDCHDYQTLARDCYPVQLKNAAATIARLGAEKARLRCIAKAADDFVRNGVPEECAELWRALKTALAPDGEKTE